MQMKLHEMEGFLRGKCLPGDMKVNETNAEYLVRKFGELEAQVKQLAAESYTNLQSAARELNKSWMMHKTMMGAQAALLCLSQGDIRSARDWLEGTTDEAFIEMPDDMTPDGLQAWFDSNMTSNDGSNGFLTQEEALEKLRQRAPSTDAVLASLRAEGVEMFAAHCQKRHGEMLKTEPNEAVINEAITATRRAGEFALYYAAQLRSQSAPSPLSDRIIENKSLGWIEGNTPSDFGRYWVRYETDVGPQYCSARWMEHNFCASSDTNIHKIWLADQSRSINPLRSVTHYTKLPEPIEGGAL